ncbi:MAG: helix-turn-helix domain-containing protein [Dysosmobacter sp.]|nr:helix-turn-helix domain-containing protein [Dysosmobacter sp.]
MISDNIRRLCQEHDTTFFAVENATGVANGSISRWDKKPPKIYNLKRVADFFGVSVDSLLEGVDDPRFRPKPRLPQS